MEVKNGIFEKTIRVYQFWRKSALSRFYEVFSEYKLRIVCHVRNTAPFEGNALKNNKVPQLVIQLIKKLTSLISVLPNTSGDNAYPEKSEAVCFQPFSSTSQSWKSAFEVFRPIWKKLFCYFVFNSYPNAALESEF